MRSLSGKLKLAKGYLSRQLVAASYHSLAGSIVWLELLSADRYSLRSRDTDDREPLVVEFARVLKHALHCIYSGTRREITAHQGSFYLPRGGVRQTHQAQPGFLPSGFFNARKRLLPPRWTKKSRFPPGLA
jgi:hypothetical protein